VGLSGSIPLADGLGLRTSLSYDREEYNFSDRNAFLMTDPWTQIDRIGLSMRLRYTLTHQWTIDAGPVVQYAGETGVEFDDSLMYGGIITAVYGQPDVFNRFRGRCLFPVSGDQDISLFDRILGNQ